MKASGILFEEFLEFHQSSATVTSGIVVANAVPRAVAGKYWSALTHLS